MIYQEIFVLKMQNLIKDLKIHLYIHGAFACPDLLPGGDIPVHVGQDERYIAASSDLEFNVKNSRSRDTLAAILYPAVCIMAYRYGIVRTSFLQEIHPAAALAAIAGATVIFMLFRALMSRIMRPSHIGAKTWKAADKAFCTYFIPAAVLSLIVSWIQELCGVEAGTIRMTILYIWGSIWLVFLFRKLQIFKNSCSLLSAILYLCSLEILPMAVLAAAALLP